MTTTQTTTPHMLKLIKAVEAAGCTATVTDRDGQVIQVDITRDDLHYGQARWVSVGKDDLRFESGHMTVAGYVNSASSVSRMLMLVEMA